MTKFQSVITAALLGTVIIGCEGIGPGDQTGRTLLVNDHQVECNGAFFLELCLLVKDPGAQAFAARYGAIEGFNYESGYVYELDVEDRPVADPPADGPSQRTVLRRVVSKTRVPPGTEFDLVLTAADRLVVEVAPDRYRFYDAGEFTCSGGSICAGLRAQIAAGARIRYRVRHPIAPSDPLAVIGWEICRGVPNETCTA